MADFWSGNFVFTLFNVVLFVFVVVVIYLVVKWTESG